MEVEIILTGDEVLRGDVADSNARHLQETLPPLGARLRRVTVVGDVAGDIEQVLERAAGRADLIVVSGGLGPTSDDLTAECAARVAGCPLVEDAGTRRRIEERWARRARPMPAGVLKQALVPQRAQVLANDEGTAPGFRLRLGKAECFFFAGVPREFRHLCARHLLPFVYSAASHPYASATLRCVLVPESEVDALLLPIATAHGARLGLRAAFPETRATLTVRGADQDEARRRLDAAVVEAAARLGPGCFTTRDEGLPEVVAQLCAAARALVAVAESCTGGLLGATLTSVAGSSGWFAGGAIVYSNEEKIRALGVDRETLGAEGAVSEAVARAMAAGARERAVAGARRATHALAITGIAGPAGGTPCKPVGTVWVALAGPTAVRAELHRFPVPDRDFIRRGSVWAAMDLLRRDLTGMT